MQRLVPQSASLAQQRQRPSWIPEAHWLKMSPEVRSQMVTLDGTVQTPVRRPHDPDCDGPHEPHPLGQSTTAALFGMPSRQRVVAEAPADVSHRHVLDPQLMDSWAQTPVPQGGRAPKRNERPFIQPRTPSRPPTRGQRSTSQPVLTRMTVPHLINEVDETDEIREGLQAITLGQRNLYSQTLQLRGRLENIEEKLVNVEADTKRTRGVARGRSTIRRDKVAATKQFLRDSSAPVRVLHAEESGEKEFLMMDAKSLSAQGKKARSALMEEIRTKFRKACGVGLGDPWPTYTEGVERSNAITREVYLTPDFRPGSTVRSAANRHLLGVIAREVKQDIQDNPSDHDPLLLDSRFYWDGDTIYSLAKNTFNNFKKSYSSQPEIDEEKAEKKVKEKSIVRRIGRRHEKAGRLRKAVSRYIDSHGVDPFNLIDSDHMSDEASGPASSDDEDQDEWNDRVRAIAEAAGNEYSSGPFTETIRPAWRSAELSAVLHELHDIYWEGLDDRGRARFNFTRVHTERQVETPPPKAPYDFGIDLTWWERAKDKPEYQALLVDWFQFGDLEGFGSKKQ